MEDEPITEFQSFSPYYFKIALFIQLLNPVGVLTANSLADCIVIFIFAIADNNCIFRPWHGQNFSRDWHQNLLLCHRTLAPAQQSNSS